MGEIASQITSLTIVYSTVYSVADQRKHQSSASLAFVRGIHRGQVNSPQKWPVTRKILPFDDVIMKYSLIYRDVLPELTRWRHLKCPEKSRENKQHFPSSVDKLATMTSLKTGDINKTILAVWFDFLQTLITNIAENLLCNTVTLHFIQSHHFLKTFNSLSKEW